ncbi:hypothetical protein GF407_05075 [candidate division KSB1 bacterium]|nr:hypothetical protein [candidate division KSB1 bacterium]
MMIRFLAFPMLWFVIQLVSITIYFPPYKTEKVGVNSWYAIKSRMLPSSRLLYIIKTRLLLEYNSMQE